MTLALGKMAIYRAILSTGGKVIYMEIESCKTPGQGVVCQKKHQVPLRFSERGIIETECKAMLI